MKKSIALIVVLSLLLLMTSAGILAQDTAKPTFKYVGAKKCRMRHNKAKTGMQYTLWERESHSKTYATLANDQSKEVAKKLNIKGDPQQAGECLVCHVTAYGVAAELKEETLTLEEGVSCEACHGPGSEYKSLKVMKDIYEGKVKGSDFGLIEITEELCVTFHNPKSPTYKEFKYEEPLKQVIHPFVEVIEQ